MADVVTTLNVELPLPPTTVAGLKVQVLGAVRPESASDTSPVNPLAEDTWTAKVVISPATAEAWAGETCNAKSGGGGGGGGGRLASQSYAATRSRSPLP